MNEETFFGNVHKTETCWLWTGSKTQYGYGMAYCSYVKDSTPAHRVSYRHYVGEIPQDYDVDHLCTVRACVNPEHLEAIPHLENLLRSNKTIAARNTQKTHCPQGHEYTEENTYITKQGWRQCRPCNRIKSREYSRRKGSDR